MSRGISNFEIKKVLEEINNDDINENFIGVFQQVSYVSKKMPGKKHPFIT